MSAEHKKIKGIIKELLSNALDAESSDINVDLKCKADHTVITVKDNGCGMDDETLEQACCQLNQSRRDDLEDYYGGLAGNSPTSSGLNMIGVMVDEAKVTSRIGEGTTVKVVRRKK